MGSIITGKPKRGRGTIRTDPNFLKTDRIIQAGKNIYQKPISFGVKAGVMGGFSTFSLGAIANKAAGISNKTVDREGNISGDMHDTFVKNWKPQMKAIWEADMWKNKK
jgi:hypothetical protein